MQTRLRAPLIATLLALLLVGMQTLALLHGVWHVPGGHAVATAAADPAIQPWFADHPKDSVTCHLLDQLSHADGTLPFTATPGPAPVVATAPPAPALPVLPGSACAYQARAPPLRA
jgi:hypothetical protein